MLVLMGKASSGKDIVKDILKNTVFTALQLLQQDL